MKNKLSMSLALLIALASGPAAALNQGDASAGNFSQACAGDIDAQRKATFFAEMDKADAALAAGQVDRAGAATMNAQRALFRGGTMADDTSIRCLGTEATQRWFDTHLALWRRGSSYGLEGRSGDFGTLIVVAHDRGTQGLVEVATGRPVAGFREAYYAIKQILDRDDWQRQFGTPLLPDEKAVVKACRDALGPLDEYRGEEITRSLAAEADAFSRPMTAQEQQNVAQLNQASQLAEAIGGAGIMTSAEDQKAMMVLDRQVRDSFSYLDKARDLEWGSFAADEKTQAAARAEERGDTLLERGNDESRSLEVRDELYAKANRYFAFCKCGDKRQAANQAKDAIQPALQALEDQRQQAADKKRAELSRQAEGMQQAIDDMQKTEAEKKSFEDEADAMEAELGF